MALYDPSQKLHEDDPNSNAWDNTISCEVGANEFIALTANTIAEGATTREMTVTVMSLGADIETPASAECNTNLYVRQEGETSIKVTVMKDGKEEGSNTANYPS